MLFKLSYTINRLDIHSHENLELDLGGSEAIRLILRAPTSEEREKGQESYNAILEIFGDFQPTKKALPVLTALIEGKRPPAGEKAKSAEEMIIRNGPSYGREYYPEPFVSFVDKVGGELSSIGSMLVSAIRWRYAQEGPPSPIGSRNFSCSNNSGDSWHLIPGRYSITSSTPPHSILEIAKIDESEIRNLIAQNLREPLYHELLREAKELQHHSPKSSIVIAVSATEVGINSVIANKVPEATWLVDNMQSPPLVKMLLEYLPDLFPQEKRFYEVNKKDRLIETIEKAVLLRNQMVHKGGSPPSRKNVVEIIDAVQELLWICDYFSGHRWAEEHIGAIKKQQE